MYKLYYVKEQCAKSPNNKMFTDLQTRDDILMNKIMHYYEQNNTIEILQKIIIGKYKLSLRIIDYFVTNYSKEKEVIYDSDNRKFMVYHDYKSQLKAYSKKQFDPFCRRDRILLYINKDVYVRTTVGQLNFFRWAITNNILDYIEKYYKEIEKEMNIFSNKNKKSSAKIKKNDSVVISSNNLHLKATKKINLHNVTMRVKFN